MRLLYLLLVLCFSFSLSAQDISLFQQLNGNYDYTAIGNTMNLVENGTNGPCEILTTSSATLQLDDQDIIINAYLYWAGSDDGDFEVMLNNTAVVADRTFADALDSGRTFFAAFADVTSQVINEGASDYTLSELDLTNIIDPYCPTGTNFAGWSLVVIYENPNLPLNQLNIYDGLQSVPESLNITLDNLNVLDTEGAKIGFLAWEGDSSLAINESLRINNTLISNPPLNPANNAFNGTNSFTGESDLFNMDIDFYPIQDLIEIGDTALDIQLTSGQDFVMVNNIITVLNSQLPDATVEITSIESACESRNISLGYTIFNENSTEPLPANTQIAFYIDEELVAQTATTAEISIDGQETGSITIAVPESVPEQFEITISVDDDGTGQGSINELNETNNGDIASHQLLFPNFDTELNDLIQCDDDTLDESTLFDLTTTFSDSETFAGLNISNHTSETDAEQGLNEIEDPTSFINTENPQSIFIRSETGADSTCFATNSFQLQVVSPPNVANLQNLEQCDFNGDGVSEFDFTGQSQEIQDQNNAVSISYHLSEGDAEMNTDAIQNLTDFENTSSSQTIFTRIENSNFSNCFIVESFQLQADICEIFIPNTVTANGDGNNDTFFIPGLEERFENYEIKIYNRWGTLVYEGNKDVPAFNGFSNRNPVGNKSLPVGTYYYVLDFNDGNEEPRVGWVYLTR